MGIIHVRIDDRLIHGQVAVVWTNTLGANRIMVVNDEASVDEMQKSILRMATPPGIKLSVLTVEKAARRIKEGRYDNDKVFMILKSPNDIMRLIKEDVEIKQINVGNMAKDEDTVQIRKTVNISEEDLNIFIQLAEKGVFISARMLPNEDNNNLMEIIKEKGLI